MPTKTLSYYCSKFESLRRDFKNGGAPHKPILLISLIQAYQNGLYTTSEIQILPELVGLFKSNWQALVETNHQCLFTLPFYHMGTEPFWELVPNRGCELWIKSKSPMRSFSNLIIAVNYARIDEDLKDLLLKKEESDILLHILLDKYFPKANAAALLKHEYGYLTDIKTQILQESRKAYQERLTQIQKELDDEGFQEEIFVRGGVFKKEVPKIYNYTCCISGLRIDAGDNISMVDACHIIPFSESFNDTISNGLSLCPNLHRALDRGLISINNDFKVIVNKNFSEPFRSAYNIRQFEGKQLLLPTKEHHFPSFESLAHHRQKFGF